MYILQSADLSLRSAIIYNAIVSEQRSFDVVVIRSMLDLTQNTARRQPRVSRVASFCITFCA